MTLLEKTKAFFYIFPAERTYERKNTYRLYHGEKERKNGEKETWYMRLFAPSSSFVRLFSKNRKYSAFFSPLSQIFPIADPTFWAASRGTTWATGSTSPASREDRCRRPNSPGTLTARRPIGSNSSFTRRKPNSAASELRCSASTLL